MKHPECDWITYSVPFYHALHRPLSCPTASDQGTCRVHSNSAWRGLYDDHRALGRQSAVTVVVSASHRQRRLQRPKTTRPPWHVRTWTIRPGRRRHRCRRQLRRATVAAAGAAGGVFEFENAPLLRLHRRADVLQWGIAGTGCRLARGTRKSARHASAMRWGGRRRGQEEGRAVSDDSASGP